MAADDILEICGMKVEMQAAQTFLKASISMSLEIMTCQIYVATVV